MKRPGQKGGDQPKRLARLLIAGLCGTSLLLLVPVGSSYADAATNTPMLCQAFADTYAARQSEDATLPSLFATPFDFETLGWMDIDVGKAVNVIKRADITQARGVAGAFFCLADGTIKQISACTGLGANADDPAGLDRFSRMGETFLDIAGIQENEAPRYAATLAKLKQAEASNEAPGPVSDYYMLGDARSAFLTSEDGALCLVITQAIVPASAVQPESK